MKLNYDMNKEQQDLINIAYNSYVDETMFSSDPTWFKAVPCIDMKTSEECIGARQYSKEEFIIQCKTDTKFSEKWGLTIEERELSDDERFRIAYKNLELRKKLEAQTKMLHYPNGHNKVMDDANIPTKLITITYNNEKIESYE